MYDTIIIGSGPAGMTAGIYAARREMKTLIIGKELGGQVMWASEIENYPGFKSISNFDLILKMKEQVTGFGVEIKTDEVKKIEKTNDGNFILHTYNNKYETKTVIVAIGLTPRQLSIKGEKELNGRGVSYCVNCDGPFFRDKIVGVAGGGNAALDAAEILSKIAKKVYLIHRRQEFRGFEALVNIVKAKKNIEFLLDNEVVEIIGKDKLEKVKVINKNSKEEREINLDGFFIEIGRIASTDLVADFADRDEKNQIIINERCETKTAGIFAAGDATQVPFKQIIIACGQASIAALSAYQYLQLKRSNNNK